MSCNGLSALPLVGTLVFFLSGSASPSFGLPPAPACQLPGRETAVPAPPCPADHEKSPTQASRCADPASQPPLQPAPEQPKTYTMTIVNGTCVTRVTFVWRDGEWQRCEAGGEYDVFYRDCTRSSWQRYGTYNSPRGAEEVACSLRTRGNLASVRRHCP